ncbi:uncharacterized protein FFC1_05777 [Fusarium fujikuroi]|nr:uncharacterized protein FFC1_05777 [Fusarium fujikuroi]
MPTITSR